LTFKELAIILLIKGNYGKLFEWTAKAVK
jgi:hypothetical protein